MTAPSTMVRASVLQGFDDFLAAKHVDVTPLLARAGVPAEAPGDIFAEVPVNAIAMILEEAAEATGDPCLGLSWAEAFPKGGTGVFGYLVLNAQTVRGSLDNVARYVSLLMHPLDVHAEEEKGHAFLSWQWPASLTAPHTQYTIFLIGLLVSRLKQASKQAWDPVMVEIVHRPLPCAERARRMMGPNVTYNAPINAIHFDAKDLDRTLASADPTLLRIVREQGEQMLAEIRTRGDLRSVVQGAIYSRLESGNATLEVIATQLGFSPRALQARLADLGTTFETLLNETRAKAAERYLRDTELSLTEIAFLLGFSELSAFSRAAQRWFRVPPSRLRDRLRA